MASRKPVRTSMSSRGQACRFHMPTGETVGLAVQEMDSIRDIKARIWAKKKFAEPQVDYVFKLPVCEIVFSDLDTFDRLLELHDIFAEKGDGASTLVLSIHIIERANMGDKKARAEKRPTSEGPFEAQGVLYKRGRNKSSKYKRRFWVLENMTLYYYENEKAYFNGKEAIDFIPMGSCQAVRTDEVYKKRPFCFEIRASHIGKKDYSLWADSEEELTKWLTAIYKVNLRRVKAISVMVIEELTRRGLENQEGLFRVSGSKEVMWGLKRKFDEGEFPMLSNTMDTAAIAGLMKLSLRNLYEPVLTFALYDRFVRCADKPAETRVAAISDTVWALPPHVRGYVSYLFQFLHTVSKYSDRNLMTPKNLAIVFGPNLLRTEEDNMATAMQDTKNILATVQAMIENYETIWSSNVVEGEGDEAASDSDSDVSEASFAGQRDEATQQEYDQAAYEQWQRQQAEYERQQAEYERQQAAYDEWQRQQAEYERQQAEYAAQQAAYEQAPQQQAHHGYSASVVPTISDNSSSVAAAAAALAAQRKPRSYTTPETAPPPGLSKPASSDLPPAVAEENPGSESKPTLTRPTSGSTGQIDFDNKSTGQIDFRSTLKKSKPKPPKRPQEKEEDEEIPEWKREFLKRQQRKASGSSADSAPASGETADEGVADGSPTVVVTRLKTPSQPGRRRSSIRMPAPASKLITVEPARLFVCKKQQEDSIGNLRKRLGEKQKALDSAWVKVTTALALGGKPSRAMFESLEGHIARETRIGKQLLSIFDDVLHSVNALAGDIEENKRAADEAERERQEAQRRAEEAERLAEAVQEEEEFVPPPPRGRGPSVAPPPPSEEMAAKYKTCYASYEYEGGHREDELVFPEQARIIILDDSDADGWWFGRLADSGKEGWFPGNYVELE